MYNLNDDNKLMLEQLKLLKKDYNKNKNLIALNIMLINRSLKNER